MDSALAFEKTLKEFFFRVKDFTRNVRFDEPNGFAKFTSSEKELNKVFNEKKTLIHSALCGNFNYFL
jgi:hypothetical protein